MSSASSSHPSFNKILTIEEQVSYILGERKGKRKREEMADSPIIDKFGTIPRFPKGDASRLDGTIQSIVERMENGEGSTSNTCRRSRRSSTSRSSSTSRPSSSNCPEWKINLIKDLNTLVLQHHVRFELMGQICNKFDCWMATGFHMMAPRDQIQQIRLLMAVDGENNITSSDANPTQPLPFSSSADC